MATSDPPEPVTAALQAADAWIEFDDSYLLYSEACKKAMQAGVRCFTLGGDVDSLVRMVGRVSYAVLDSLAEKLIGLSNQAAEMYITSSSGTDLRAGVYPAGSEGHVMLAGEDGGITVPGAGTTQVPPGQSSFGHVQGSIEGTLVFDGAVCPPAEIGVLREPVTLDISEGKIASISGGREARVFEKWLDTWNHPGM